MDYTKPEFEIIEISDEATILAASGGSFTPAPSLDGRYFNGDND